MNEQMNPEDAIERVLTGLGSVQAPPQIESRILDAMQRRLTAQEASMVRLPFLRTRSWALAAGVLVLALVASVAMRKRHEAEREDAVLKQEAAPHVAGAPPLALADAKPERRLPLPNPSALQNTRAVANAEVLRDLDALAISEMNAPSKPAPTLPLTHQEKLFAETMHEAGTKSLSSLRPEVRPQQFELSLPSQTGNSRHPRFAESRPLTWESDEVQTWQPQPRPWKTIKQPNR